MLSVQAQVMVGQLARVLATEGMSGTFVRAQADQGDPCGNGMSVKFLLRHPSTREDAIVNAYGVNAQIVTLAHCDEFAQRPPQKFDVLVQGEERYVFDAVTRRAVGDVVVGWTGFCRGKGA
jgi:hypothetical protein